MYNSDVFVFFFFFFQAEDGIRDIGVTGVQTCALPIYVLTEIYQNEVNSLFDFLLQIMDKNSPPEEGILQSEEQCILKF